MTITEFLLARIAEDEDAAREWLRRVRVPESVTDTIAVWIHNVGERVLADCEAKRRIVALHDEGNDGPCQSSEGNYSYEPCGTIRALANVYVDHPDYREEWRL